MQELIKVTADSKGEQVVSARDLYEFLQITERFSQWCQRMFTYGFMEGQDYIGCKIFNTLANQDVIDYILTLDTAKEIAMLQRSDRGKQARQYFIECEKRLRAQQSQAIAQSTPQSYADALRALAEKVEAEEKLKAEKEKLESENAKLAPKAEYTDKVLASVTDITTTTIAKELGMSAIKLNKILCQEKIQYYQDGHYVLYSKYQSKGYTETRTYQWYDKSGVSHTKHSTVWTERGRALVHSVVNQSLSFNKKKKEVSNVQ